MDKGKDPLVNKQEVALVDASAHGDDGYGSLESYTNGPSLPYTTNGDSEGLTSVHLCEEVHPPTNERFRQPVSPLESDIGKPLEEGHAKSVRAWQPIPEITESRKFTKWTSVQVTDIQQEASSLILGISHTPAKWNKSNTAETAELYKYSIEETNGCHRNGGVLVTNPLSWCVLEESMMVFGQSCDEAIVHTGPSTLIGKRPQVDPSCDEYSDIFSSEERLSSLTYNDDDWLLKKQCTAGHSQQCTSTGGPMQYIMGM